MLRKKSKGQSTLEYALLITVVLLAVIYGANTVVKARLRGHMDAAGGVMTRAQNEFQNATGTTTP